MVESDEGGSNSYDYEGNTQNGMGQYQPNIAGNQIVFRKEEKHSGSSDNERNDQWRDHDRHDRFTEGHVRTAETQRSKYAQCSGQQGCNDSDKQAVLGTPDPSVAADGGDARI